MAGSVTSLYLVLVQQADHPRANKTTATFSLSADRWVRLGVVRRPSPPSYRPRWPRVGTDKPESAQYHLAPSDQPKHWGLTEPKGDHSPPLPPTRKKHSPVVMGRRKLDGEGRTRFYLSRGCQSIVVDRGA
ncbi:hypothetical protein LZ30DRAFT_691697 [Colletotrichum cereale]|nr:hypothetical protein LZ30DRAFT_691697 [Colletotrichum cereale]